MSQINQQEKTLVFCATQDHALAVRDLINQMKTSTDPNYCQRVTANDGELGEQHLRDFQDNEKTIPTILTTSQKLSTGVDARNIRNIVLMRPINSMIEFKQIIGRGTRLYDGKDYFTIYDFVKAHHHFSDPEWDGEPMEPEPAKRAVKSLVCVRASATLLRCGQQPCECERTLPKCGKRPCECKRKAKVNSPTGRNAHHPTHDGHDASGTRTARRCRRSSFWKCCSGSSPSFSRTRPNSVRSGARPIPGPSSYRVSRKRDSARTNGGDATDHRCGEERSLRRAGPCGLCAAPLTREERAHEPK